MNLSIAHADEVLELDCFDNWLSRWVCSEVLAGETYSYLDFVDGIETILDVGANCGATSVFFSACYPAAVIHAFEPSAETFRLLERNAARRTNIVAHNIGLHQVDQEVPLYRGAIDGVTSSVVQRDNTSEVSELVTLRSASAWLEEHGIERVDLLKVDVEGCEVDVLLSLRHVLPKVKVLYVEYDTKEARLEIEDLLRDTHWLCIAQMLLSQGEAVYVSNEVLADEKAVEQAILALWRKKIQDKRKT